MKGISIENSKLTHNDSFPVVAIGASAGGLEAITELLKHLPVNCGMCYIYIQHLSPSHESKLAEILGRVTAMPVLEAKDQLKIRPDQVYIIPPNREMTVADGILKLSLRPTIPQKNLPINRFFISLADNYREKAIGILLSGNPPD